MAIQGLYGKNISVGYKIDHDELEKLSRERFGRTVFITNRTDWMIKKQ